MDAEDPNYLLRWIENNVSLGRRDVTWEMMFLKLCKHVWWNIGHPQIPLVHPKAACSPIQL